MFAAFNTDKTSAIVIELRIGTEVKSWRVEHGAAFSVDIPVARAAGTVSLLNELTCELQWEAELGQVGDVAAEVSRGADGSGPWHVTFRPARPAGNFKIAPTGSSCETGR